MIYLDYAATTPVDERVAEKMLPFLTSVFGNPASTHAFGQKAKAAVDVARREVAAAIGADPAEIIWTSGATESNNLAIRGSAELYVSKGKHIVTMKTEHPSVLETCQQLEKEGWTVTYLAPQKNGLIDLENLKQSLRDDTVLVSVMQVNNETGVIQPLEKIAEITAAKNILFHVDAAQSIGKLALDIKNIDLISLCAHKSYGPKGIGALYIRRKPRVRVAPQIYGGGQEQGMRSGTLATHQMVGMGEAFMIAHRELQEEQKRMCTLRDYFLTEIAKNKSITLNNNFDHVVPSIINLRFSIITAEAFMKSNPELAISSGSACQSKGIEPSYVLRAMGLSVDEAKNSVRISFGRFSTKRDVETLLQALSAAI